MPISLTGLVTGANRLIAGRARGRTEGREMRMQEEERRQAAARLAIQDSINQEYLRAQTTALRNRPAPLTFEQQKELRAVPSGSALTFEQRKELQTAPRSSAPRAGRRPDPEYTPIQISRALVNVPLTDSDGEPLPESQRQALAVQWLDTHPPGGRRRRVVPALPPPR